MWRQEARGEGGMEQGWEQAGPDVTLSQSVTMLLSRSPPLRCTALNVIFHFQMKDDPFDPYDHRSEPPFNLSYARYKFVIRIVLYS